MGFGARWNAWGRGPGAGNPCGGTPQERPAARRHSYGISGSLWLSEGSKMRRPEELPISKINNRKSSINLGWSAIRNLTAFALWHPLTIRRLEIGTISRLADLEICATGGRAAWSWGSTKNGGCTKGSAGIRASELVIPSCLGIWVFRHSPDVELVRDQVMGTSGLGGPAGRSGRVRGSRRPGLW